MKRYCLRNDLAIVEQVLRGEHSYVVKDHETHKYFRFKPLEVFVMQQLDGERTAAEISAALAEQGLPFKPAAVESFTRKLDSMGLLEKSVAEKSVLLMERLRAERNRRVKRTHYQGSILRMRWTIGDPDAALSRWMPRMEFFFSKPFLTLSVLLYVVYAAIVSSRWPDVAGGLKQFYTPSAYTLGFVVTLWCTALIIVAVHELGHAFTCKRFGGEVHEMGFMLVYLQPAFYCNVNDAWTFPDRNARLWVTAAGSWIQMVVAGLAAMVWWAAEPGTLISQIALVAVIFGGFATVVANANPLLPLDGYYALSDYLEVPNLRKRAFDYVGWLLKRYVLRLAVVEPQATEREKRVFVVYGLLAIWYSTSILLFLAGRLFGWFGRVFGTLGALFFLYMVFRALQRRLRGLVQSVATSVREHRSAWRPGRVRWVVAGLSALVLLGLVVPWPIVVKGRFAAGAPLEMALAAPEDAVVSRVYAGEGARVEAGVPLVALRSLALERDVLFLGRRLDSLEARTLEARAAGLAGDLRVVEELRAQARGALEAARARLALLTLRAPLAAVVATPRLQERTGRRVERGDTAVRLLAIPDTVEVRIALDRAGAVLVRPGQWARVVPLSDVGAAVRVRVADVSAAGTGDRDRPDMEARARLPASGAFRPGVTGEAKIVVRRTSALGALWWAVRKRFRSDLVL